MPIINAILIAVGVAMMCLSCNRIGYFSGKRVGLSLISKEIDYTKSKPHVTPEDMEKRSTEIDVLARLLDGF